MKSKIISVGDEILIGQIINTNAAYIGDKLFSAGIPVERTVVICDEVKALLDELEDSMQNYDVTIITGGLGPTHDDVTKPALIKFFNDRLVTDKKVLRHVKKIFSSRNLPMPEINIAQALVPENSKVIWNKNGTAPGIWIESNNRVVIALPGVPYEMKAMIDEEIVPELVKKFGSKLNYALRQKTLLTTGLGESTLSERLGDISKIIGKNKLAFLPSAEGVRLRINVVGKNDFDAEMLMVKIESRIRKKASDYIFGTGEEKLEQIIGEILRRKKKTLSVAESCTGGMISEKIVSVPGASDYFMGSVCAYSNKEKIKILNVSADTLKKFGAVSKETAIEMAAGVRKLMETDIAISVTGIAGPAGGSKIKPVGLVWIGFSDNTKCYAKEFNFGNNRERNISRASQRALEILRRELLKIKVEF